ncbi:TerC family protein [Paenibacillus aurantius]|uniref:TerC family protein n=1 Tax=Paenibacillus aurantius TaxID=2918900 RepID=A0AA96LAW4_9BACL|nr:TerC family protein [Paenibacillus aurantius]WJH34556.1 TerC family protein [Paenibacillus sp. CC-CFT747]WNQ09769.1 TerC family protein [Paenibacillus aurantius]
MEFLTPEFFTALLSIIIIDLVLAGDNAIVIGMAARNVPKEMQKRVIAWGTLGAIVIRIVATLAVAWLLKIPGLLLVGGILLLWISYKLLTDKKGHELEAKTSVWDAIKTIIIADAAMGMDNVLAVAGAAHGSFLLVIIGLLISIPIVVWGSTLFVKIIDRFPVVIYAGAGILAYTAAKMIVEEPVVHDNLLHPVWGKWTVISVVVLLILGLGYMRNRVGRRQELPDA